VISFLHRVHTDDLSPDSSVVEGSESVRQTTPDLAAATGIAWGALGGTAIWIALFWLIA
jgi:hypothetical protein